jgi:1-acyl-sn-glycerol-3-phosphate acyltransferase
LNEDPASASGGARLSSAAREPARAGRWKRPLRVLWRLPAVLAGTAMLAVVWFARLPFAADAARRREWRGTVFRAWARWCLWCAGVRVEVSGSPPAAPCFLVANHCGYVDIGLLASQVNSVFLSSDDVERIPFVGWMARSFGTVFIDRGKKRDLPAVTRVLGDALDRGELVVLFPEGTNSRGDRVHRFHPSLLQIAVERGAPVGWATLRHATGPHDVPASRSVCWVDAPLWKHMLGFLALERVDSTLIFGSGTLRGTDRKSLARELEARVAAQFTPMA